MNEFLIENLAKFLFDTSKYSFIGLVLTVIAKRPFVPSDLVIGIMMTLILLGMAVTISLLVRNEED